MNVLLRFLANPKLLKRFLGTKAGRAAALKWGRMLVNSRAVQSMVGKFMNKNGGNMKNSKNYAALEQKYKELQAKVEKLEQQVSADKNSDSELQTATFTLGRQVVEMQRLYAQMQMDLQKLQQAQMINSAVQHTR